MSASDKKKFDRELKALVKKHKLTMSLGCSYCEEKECESGSDVAHFYTIFIPYEDESV
jgi:predicted outer membrane protein